jgi:hypothetical protein
MVLLELARNFFELPGTSLSSMQTPQQVLLELAPELSSCEEVVALCAIPVSPKTSEFFGP